MSLREHVYSVLLVSNSEKFNRSLLTALPERFCYPIRVVMGVGAARQELLERSYDVVMINTPLPDDYGTRLAIDLSCDLGIGVMIFAKSENFSDVYEQVSEYGVLTMQKPTSGQMVSQSMFLLFATIEKLKRMEKKAASLEEKMQEIRLVNRAKWILIDKEGYSEQDAHRYIEKTAMDNCLTRASVARGIIERYE